MVQKYCPIVYTYITDDAVEDKILNLPDKASIIGFELLLILLVEAITSTILFKVKFPPTLASLVTTALANVDAPAFKVPPKTVLPVSTVNVLAPLTVVGPFNAIVPVNVGEIKGAFAFNAV